MQDPTSSNSKSPMGGGAPLAGFILLGTVLGIAFGEPSIGILTGIGLGALVAVIIWLKGA